MTGDNTRQQAENGSTWPAEPADVTCLITSHGRPNFIPDAIRSVFAQTEAVAEIVVVSDIEAPETEQIVLGLAETGPVPVRWVDRSREDSPGVSRSRNRGIAEAQTRWVAILDDDDQWVPTFAAEMCDAVNRSRALVAFCAKVRFGRPKLEGTVIPVIPDLSPSEMLRTDIFAHGGNLVISVALAEQFPYDENLQAAEDWDLFIRLGNAGIPYEAVENPLLHSRFHDGQRLTEQNLLMATMCRRVLDKHRDSIDLRARRAVMFRVLWFERRALETRTTRERLRYQAYAPYERLFTDSRYRRRRWTGAQRALSRRTGRDR